MIWLLAFLACYRMTRLVTADEITKPLRIWAVTKSQRVGYLMSCDWCLSIWLAPLVAIPVTLWPNSKPLQALLLWLSLSAVAGLVSVIEGRLERE